MSQATQSTTFESLSNLPGLNWADEMNEIADAEEANILPTLPEWKPLMPLNQVDDQYSQSAQGGGFVTSFNDLLQSSNTNAQEHAEELAAEVLDEAGTFLVNDDNVVEEDGYSSDEESPESSESGDADDPTSEEETGQHSKNEQQESLGSMSTCADSESESSPGSSEQDYNASSASGDDDDPSFAPYHPGWTKQLSPSISPYHSTPPEVNRWVFSAPIGLSLQNDLDQVLLDEDCPNLARPATVSRALMHTDNDPFEGYAFPYGARGVKRPLPKPLPRRSMLFPRNKPEAYQRSRLSHLEAVDYSQQDLQFINSNTSEHTKELSRNATPEELENQLPACPEQSSASVEEPSEHSSSEVEGGNDLWSPTADDVDQGSNSSVDQDECVETELTVSKEGSHTWESISEPDLETDYIFDLGDQETHVAHFVKYASYQDKLAYLDLAVTCKFGLTDMKEGKSVESLPLPDSDIRFGATYTRELTTEDLDPSLKIKCWHDSSSQESQSFDDSSDIDISFDVDMTYDERSEGAAEKDTFDEVYELAVATALPIVDFAEDNVEYEQLYSIPVIHGIGDERKEQFHQFQPEEKIGYLQGPGLRFFGGLMAAGTFLWDCLNDRPLVLDNPW